VLHNGRVLCDAGINVREGGLEQKFRQEIAVRAGDTIDCVCGFGNGNYGADTTALAIAIKTAAGRLGTRRRFPTAEPKRSLDLRATPAGPAPDIATFTRFRSAQWRQPRRRHQSRPRLEDIGESILTSECRTPLNRPDHGRSMAADCR